ncbi:MAG: hypothetical protein Q7R62_01220 [bacterium]|nr:hypothetical protein [bacterium]
MNFFRTFVQFRTFVWARTFVWIFFVFSYTFVFSYANASTLGFSTSKSLFEAEILPGMTYQDTFVVVNNSDEVALPLHLQLSLWDLAEGSEEDIEFINSEKAINAVEWFSLVTSGGKKPGDPVKLRQLNGGYDFILDPGEGKELTFRVTPPTDAPAGTYLVSMRFQAALPEHYFESVGPRFIPEMVSLFFLKVPFLSIDGSTVNYVAEILDFGLKSKIQTKPGVIEVAKADVLDNIAKVMAAKVKNIGAYYFKADGSLQIRSWTGRTVKNIPLPGKYMLPGKTRTLEIPLTGERDGESIFSRVGGYLKDSAYLGRYTATLVLNYPQTGVPGEVGFTSGTFTEKTIKFWIFPWRLMLLIIICVALITLLVKRFGRRVRRAFRIILRGRA